MARVIIALALGLIGLAVLILVAPILLIAAVVFLLIAWKRPAAAERVSSHQRLARVPTPVRSTPMRFGSALVAGTFALTLVSAAVARPSDQTPASASAEPTTEVARDEATEQPTPSPTERPTPRPTRRPTPAPTPTPDPTPVFGEEPTGPIQLATVASVTDGDTIRVLIDGQNVPVRYIGIDTPETQNTVEWMGAEASAANAALVAGQQVYLEKDISDVDQYGRLLRYVWVERETGWLLVNLELLRQGYAQVTTYPPDVKYVDALFIPAQQEARDAGRGLWGVPPTPVPTPVPVPTAAPPSNCHPSYVGYCLTMGIGDWDCASGSGNGPNYLPVTVQVVGYDEYGLDGDGDGWGCE